MDDESYDYRSRPHKWPIEIVAGDKPSSPRHQAALYELERRKGRTARLSLAVALISLVVTMTRSMMGEPGHYTFVVRNEGFVRGDTKTGEAVMLTMVNGKAQVVPIPFK